MTINIKDKATGETLPLVSMKTTEDGHEILSVTCGFGGEDQWKTYNCLDASDNNILANADLPFTVEIQDRDMLGLLGE